MNLSLGLSLTSLATLAPGQGLQLINGLLVLDNRPPTLENRVMRLSNGN